MCHILTFQYTTSSFGLICDSKLTKNVLRRTHLSGRYVFVAVIVGSEGSVDVLEMALRMASEPQDTGTYSIHVVCFNKWPRQFSEILCEIRNVDKIFILVQFACDCIGCLLRPKMYKSL